MDKRLVRELIRTRQAVKRKYQSLKADIAQSQSVLEEQYKPISQPLKELLSTIKTEGVQPKSEILELTQSPKPLNLFDSPGTPATVKPRLFTRKISPLYASTPIRSQSSYLREDVIPEQPYENADSENAETGLLDETVQQATVNEALNSIRSMMRPEAMEEYLAQYEGLARQYIEAMMMMLKIFLISNMEYGSI